MVMRTVVLGVAVVASALTAGAMAQSISTTTPNNGSGGVFLQLTPNASPIQVDSFQTYFSSAAGTPVTVEVWTRPGAYAGFTASNVGWTLHQTVVGTSAGAAGLSGPVAINPLLIATGGPTSIYFHAITAGGGIRYTGLAATPPQTTWANADVTLFSDISRTGAVPFAGTQFTPRTFAGTINYTIIPAPASLALLGLGGLVAARRRR
jgi:hypothetical protein